MRKDEQSGFILMIAIMVVLASLIIWFAVHRITQANNEPVPALKNTQSVFLG